MRLPATPPPPGQVFAQRHADMQSAMQVKAFNEFIRKCERYYWPWDKVRLAARDGISAELAWAFVKLSRMQRFKYLPLTGRNIMRLRYNMSDKVQEELMHIDQELAGRLISDDEVPLTPHQKERFIIGALREEAISSSMLEGAATTRRNAKELLKSGRKPRTIGEKMVLNNYLAIQFIRDNRKMDLSPALLLELQTILTRETLDSDDQVGRFRTDSDDITIVDVRDGEIMHTPPPASELESRIDKLCKFANDEGNSPSGFIHPVVQACIIHFQLGFDHPFCDGNGRTARALFYWLMLRKGYWLFEYIPISRLIYNGPSQYARAFLYCETDEFDVTYFLTYKAKIIERARTELHQYIRDKQHQVASARRLFAADQRLNYRQQELALRITRNPDLFVTIGEHQNHHAIAYGTARSDLLKMVDWGYLMHDNAGKRHDFHPSPKLLGGTE